MSHDREMVRAGFIENGQSTVDKLSKFKLIRANLRLEAIRLPIPKCPGTTENSPPRYPMPGWENPPTRSKSRQGPQIHFVKSTTGFKQRCPSPGPGFGNLRSMVEGTSPAPKVSQSPRSAAERDAITSPALIFALRIPHLMNSYSKVRSAHRSLLTSQTVSDKITSANRPQHMASKPPSTTTR
jgi:hypothetical protein